MRFQWIVGLVFLCAVKVNAQSEPPRTDVLTQQKIANFKLKDYNGKRVSLNGLKKSHFVVVVFLGVECPLAKIYSSRLQSIASDYRDRGVAFIGIDANRQDSLPEIAAYARLHKLDFPILKDPGNRVADQFAATRVSEVFVLDSDHNVRFHGRIDDQYGPGYAKPKPQRDDLRQALDELLAGSAVSVPTTEVVGCRIGRARAPNEKSAVTYSSHIAEILNRRCVECHRQGEIAPFSLTDYEEVAGWADMIAEVVGNERMPPWHADARYEKFVGDRRLSDEEKKLIQDWCAAGAPLGDPDKVPETAISSTSGWQLECEPEMVIPMRDTPFTVPAEGIIDYQFFVVDPGFKEDKWITATELLPGNRAVVHHATVFSLVGTREDALKDGTTDGYLATYVPGLRPRPFPSGMAKRIIAGSQLVFQIHYSANGSEQLDTTKLGLVFADEKDVEYEVVTGSVVNRTFVIPPGESRYRVSATSVESPRNSRLLSMMPHMHARGAAFRFELLLKNGISETVLQIPRYDFNWQTAYQLVDPRVLPAGSQIRCTALYDNSENNLANPNPTREIRHGIQQNDEMMVGYFDVAVRRNAERERRTQPAHLLQQKRTHPRGSR